MLEQDKLMEFQVYLTVSSYFLTPQKSKMSENQELKLYSFSQL